jgi:hypothetical protein
MYARKFLNFRQIDWSEQRHRDADTYAPHHSCAPLAPYFWRRELTSNFPLTLFDCLISRTFLSKWIVFFSHNKSANSTFSHGLSVKRTEPRGVDFVIKKYKYFGLKRSRMNEYSQNVGLSLIDKNQVFVPLSVQETVYSTCWYLCEFSNKDYFKVAFALV